MLWNVYSFQKRHKFQRKKIDFPKKFGLKMSITLTYSLIYCRNSATQNYKVYIFLFQKSVNSKEINLYFPRCRNRQEGRQRNRPTDSQSKLWPENLGISTKALIARCYLALTQNTHTWERHLSQLFQFIHRRHLIIIVYRVKG